MAERHEDTELRQHEQLDLRAAPAKAIAGMPSAEPHDGDAPIDEIGSYGRGIYAGHSTYGLDYRTQGSYGRGIYAGHSTFDLDYDTQGSYGRGIYAGHSTFHLDFRRRDSFARGMEQRSAKEARRRDGQTEK
jgi:hypothetical protein